MMPIRRRASAVILKDDQILMVKIADQGRSWWCLPGGTIQAGETPEQVVLCELQEELNLNVIIHERLYKTSIPDERGVDYGILVDLPAGKPSPGIDPAVVDWAWVPLDGENKWWQVELVREALAGKES